MKRKFAAKLMASLLAMTTAASVIALPAAATDGSWKKDNTGWWYSYSTGSYAKNGWAKINGVWYFFTPSGYMKTGWVQDGGKWYYLASSGAMKTGWVLDKGVWYYMDASGKMLQNTTTIINGVSYTFNASGALVDNPADGEQRMYFTQDSIDIGINSTGIFLTSYTQLENIHDGSGVYTSADESIVRFDSFKMVPVKAGTTTVTYTYTTGAGKVLTDSIQVTVSGEKPAEVIPCTPEGVFEKINEYREENGLKPLVYVDELQNGADIRAMESFDEFEGERSPHIRPDGSKYYTAYGNKWRYCLWEASQRTSNDVNNNVLISWKLSPSHKAILLKKDAKGGAVGVYKIPGTNNVCIVFATTTEL